MERHGGLGHLVSAGSRAHRVAGTAIHTSVTVVAKAPHIFCGRVNWSRAARLVASTARIDIASRARHLCRHRGFGGMALQARRVGVRS